jgi:hypothetical protein
MDKNARRLLALCISAALTGCGGEEESPAAVELGEITIANAPTIASAVLVAAFESGDLGVFATSDSTPVASAKAAPGALLKYGQSSYMQVPVGPETVPCDFGGTVTMTGDIANPLTLSAGDRITLAYAACDDGESVTDGTFAMTITAFSGDFVSGMFALGIAVDVTAFQVATAAETVTADGDISVTLNALSSPTLAVTLASTSLAVGSNGASHELSGFAAAQNVNQATGEYTFDAGGTIASSVFDGAVNFDTTEAFAGVGVEYPASGEMLVTGADNGTIRVIALDNVFVRLEIDADGNGTVDAVIDTTWEELR